MHSAGPSPSSSVLGTAPGRLDEAEARDLARRHFGIEEGVFRPLTSERDVNWHIAGGSGSYVLKLANRAEPAEVTAFQTAALVHLQSSGLPVPRVVPALEGGWMVGLPQGQLRLLTYLDGRLMHRVPQGAALRRSMGAINARLTAGLASFHAAAPPADLQWDVRHAGRLGGYLAALPADLAAPVSRFVDRFDDRHAAALAGCPWQVVHNDLNPHNVLVSDDGLAVTGILDFGDLVRTPRICDLGVTASYQVDPAAPLDSLVEFARAYHAELPLTGAEARLILPMTMARWVTTLCITAHRAARYPENAAYILRNVPQARAGFLAGLALEQEAAEARLLKELNLS